MQKPVYTCSLPTDVGRVRDLMTLKQCHAIPLVEVDDQKNVRIRGIVTSDDLVGVYDDNVDIRQVMNTKVQTVTPGTDAREAAQLMLKHLIHHLVVMEAEQIVGIISSLDFVKLVAKA
jgi:CBS domain-containing protein